MQNNSLSPIPWTEVESLTKIDTIADPVSGKLVKFGWRRNRWSDIIRSRSQSGPVHLGNKHVKVIEAMINHGLGQLTFADPRYTSDPTLTFHFGAAYGHNRNLIIHQDLDTREHLLVSEILNNPVQYYNHFTIRIDVSDLEMYQYDCNIILGSNNIPFVMTEKNNRRNTLSHNWCIKFENRTSLEYFKSHFGILVNNICL